MTRKQLEQKYSIRIADDSYVNPISGRFVRAYKIYSADGCCWEKGLRNLKAVKAECEQWKNAFAAIAEVRG